MRALSICSVFASPRAGCPTGTHFDNLTVSPRGGVLLCEDGGGVEDACERVGCGVEPPDRASAEGAGRPVAVGERRLGEWLGRQVGLRNLDPLKLVAFSDLGIEEVGAI